MDSFYSWFVANTNGIVMWIAAIITLGIYSFLYADNKIYRFLMSIMVGVGVGYGFMVTWLQTVGPKWWDPMWSGFTPNIPKDASFFSATTIWIGALAGHVISHPGTFALFMVLAILGSLWYFQLSRNMMWPARIPMGIMMGAGAGVVFKQQFLTQMPQIVDSFRPLIASAPKPAYQYGAPLGAGMGFDIWQTMTNILYIATIVGVMTYFFFSFPHDRKAIAGTAKFGRWMLMLSFGAFFGNTVMTRMSFFLQRVQFLVKEWAPYHSSVGGLSLPDILWALIICVPILIIYGIFAMRKPPQRPPSAPTPVEEPVLAPPGVSSETNS